MRIAFDIGGVISKYPAECIGMMRAFREGGHFVYAITDMHDLDKIIELLRDNGVLEFVAGPGRIQSADYATHGDACKAVLLREISIDVFVDDHPGYLAWPWPTPAPLRLRVEPDQRRPYWHPSWKCNGGDFGRRVFLDKPERADTGIDWDMDEQA